MFGGVGTEWLYRPFGGKTAVGVDANYVRQRNFEQDFGFRDYRVATGHVTLYLDTGWQDVLATVSAGRYLARDVGATVQLSRVFKNGVTLGAYATKTNVSAAQFGEGSFDKGIFISIPLDAMLTRSTGLVGTVLWKPIIRDGGAKLSRQDTLYDITSLRDPRTLWYQPAAKTDEFSITPPAPAPYLRAPARASEGRWSSDSRYRHELVQALYGQGFRNIQADYDASGRLNLRLENPEIRPAERAIGRAARTALRHAPLEAREMRVTLLEDSNPVAIYEFTDLALLDRYFGGSIGQAELKDHVALYYADATARPANPLALLNDLNADPTPPTLPSVLLESRPVRAVERAAGDSVAAAKDAAHSSWARDALIGGGVDLPPSPPDPQGLAFPPQPASSPALEGSPLVCKST